MGRGTHTILPRRQFKRRASWFMICISLFMMLFYMPLSIYATETDTFPVVSGNEEDQAAVEALDQQAQTIMDNLYNLEQKIQQSEKRLEEINENMIQIEDDMTRIRSEIIALQARYDQDLIILGQVLRVYQKRGISSYFEAFLEADSLTDLFNRFSIINAMTIGTKQLLEDIDQELSALEEQEAVLKGQEEALLLEKNNLDMTLTQLDTEKLDLENALESLEEERAVYEERLTIMREAWEALKPVFKQASEGFATLAEAGVLPQEAMELKLGSSGFEAWVAEEGFDQAVKDYDPLPDMNFDFKKDQVVLTIEEQELILKGNFEVVDDHTLRYVATEGTFFGSPLDAASIEALFEEGALVLNLKPLTGNNKIKASRSEQGALVLTVSISLF